MDDNTYRHPKKGFLTLLIEAICNSNGLRAIRRVLFSFIPFIKLESSVVNIVYCNWLVDIDKVNHLFPDQASLININGKTVLSVLTYKHENFRPSILNPIKALFPSPLQSNWRLYVSSFNGKNSKGAVFFIKNIMNNLLFTVGTRFSSDAMLTHYPKAFKHGSESEKFITEISPGLGSSPDLLMEATQANQLELPDELIEHFKSQDAALEYLCIQEIAYTEATDVKGLCKAEIELPIDTNAVVPLKVESISSLYLSEITENAKPFAFLVPKVHFGIIDETIVN